MNDPQVVHVLLHPADFKQAAELDYLVFKAELEDLVWLGQDEPYSDEKCIAALEIL